MSELDISGLRCQFRRRLIKSINKAVDNTQTVPDNSYPETLVMSKKQLQKLVDCPQMELSWPPDYLYQTPNHIMEVIVK